MYAALCAKLFCEVHQSQFNLSVLIGWSCLWRQHWPGRWSADWISPCVLWLRVHIWGLPEVSKLCCGVLCGETSHTKPSEIWESKESHSDMLPHHQRSSKQNQQQRKRERTWEGESFRFITERVWTWTYLHSGQYLHISYQVVFSIWGVMIPALFLCQSIKFIKYPLSIFDGLLLVAKMWWERDWIFFIKETNITYVGM